MRNFLALFLVFNLAAPVFAAEVGLYECKTIKQEPEDPTPVRALELRRENDGKYSAHYTTDIEKKPFSSLLTNLTCQFRRVVSCDKLKSSFSECQSIDPSSPEWNKPEPHSVLFDCAEEGSFPRRALEGTLIPSLKIMKNGRVFNLGSSLDVIGYNVPNGNEGVVKGIFHNNFEIAANCKTKEK